MDNDSRKPKTLNDIINPKQDSAVYNSLNTEDRFRYLMMYVQENKNLNVHHHIEVIERVDKKFSSTH
tara:strand:+ start:176 stop:376 length:201 start_codon:yes stop_codon:yes gene_type:complete